MQPSLYPSSRPIKHSGIVAGEVTGWRSWRLKPDGFLYSMTNETKWVPGRPVSGIIDEYLGVHSWREEQSLRNYINDWAPMPLETIVLGTIAMWGEVVEHKLGYRAEYAKVLAIKSMVQQCLPDGLLFSNEKLVELCSRYGVDYL
jgi:hypothetical protein